MENVTQKRTPGEWRELFSSQEFEEAYEYGGDDLGAVYQTQGTDFALWAPTAERAELLLALPSDWQVNAEDEQWYWPIRLLKQLARLPGEEDAWLGWGHTIDNGEPYADNTQLCAALLVSPVIGAEEAETAQLPSGEEVNFYQVIPLYRGELDYKLANGTDALLDELEDICIVVHPDRPDFSAAEGFGQRETLMDNALWHLSSIQEKQLPVEEITAYDHLAIYLRWALAHDMMSAAFLAQYADLAARFQADPTHTDLRPFIRDELNGILTGIITATAAHHIFRQTLMTTLCSISARRAIILMNSNRRRICLFLSMRRIIRLWRR